VRLDLALPAPPDDMITDVEGVVFSTARPFDTSIEILKTA
jgi:hypothetical protein